MSEVIGIIALMVIGVICVLFLPKRKVKYVYVYGESGKGNAYGEGYLKERKKKKKKFVVKHQKLCKEAFKHGTDHQSYKSEAGMKLIELARKELEYKPTTYSGDIYYGLWCEYEDMVLN